MCLLFISYKGAPGVRLVVAANRDEFLDRPTVCLDVIDENRKILGGRDLRCGGTWLAVASGGRIGAITNYRDPSMTKENAPSRGDIILDFLRQKVSASVYLHKLHRRKSEYNGFNLVLADDTGLWYYSNISCEIKQLFPGFYGLSNHLLDTPWPKVERGKKMLRPLMEGVTQVDQKSIFHILNDSCVPDFSRLPDTGVGPEWEKLLGTIFIDGPGYGTRSSAVVTVYESGRVSFGEQTYLRRPDRVMSTFVVQKEMDPPGQAGRDR
ncbi:NRDE family protein [Desulforhopalus singaporensis]|uniref:Uncharacterized conserved protein, contains NRDE domain n=1 Tax=Desulforhopalus singaporensis TaxID=91360 RepID=A0A1H0JBQ4_9BACT|nr:NRDE family protein [Desulforhopalus singaporensis]SDO40761.1 Uncharacterized conserved protein, contains NRDE domain [Desulforhopalus singaporensis]